MSDMYNKIFTKILDSSVWLEPTSTRIVWITFIAAMDETGFCPFAAVGNVAARARVTEEEAKKAIKALEGPDPESSDQDNEGRRLERVPGGWLVLNAPKYRALVTKVNIQEKVRERVRRFREKKKSGNASVTECNDSVMQSEAVSGSVTPLPPASGGRRKTRNERKASVGTVPEFASEYASDAERVAAENARSTAEWDEALRKIRAEAGIARAD
jgi:hypothetical protein